MLNLLTFEKQNLTGMFWSGISYPNIENKIFKRCILLIFAFSFIIYGKSIRNGYAMDDEYVINNNKQVQKGIKAIPEILSTTYANDGKQKFEYRPLVKVTYAIEYQIFGKNLLVNHIVNILFYALCVVLLFIVLLKLFPEFHYFFSLTIALLFLFHPLHSEVALSLKNRDGMLSFLNCFLALFFCLRYVENNKIINVIWAGIFMLLGMLSKKDVMPFYVIIPFTLWYFKNISWKKVIGVFILLFQFSIVFIIAERLVDVNKARTMLFWENPLFIDSTMIERIPQGFYSIYFYLKMFLIPHPLLSYYGYNQVPVVGWSHPIVWIMLFIVGLITYLIIKNFKSRPVWIYAFIYFLVSISMFLNVVTPVVGIVGERFAFIPSVGLCILIIYLLFKYFKIPVDNLKLKMNGFNKNFIIVFILMILIAGGKTIARNGAWKDTYTLYKADAAAGTESAHTHSLLATAAIKKVQEKAGMPKSEKRKLIFEAEEHFLEALRIYPDYTSVHNNLGMVYYTYLRNNDKAISHFNKALALDSNYVEAYFNLASSYASKEEFALAEKHYLKTIELDPEFKNTYQSLSGLYAAQKKDQRIIELNQKAIDNGVKFDGLYINIANVYYLAGDTLSALPYLEEAIRINPNNQNLNSFLASYYQKKGEKEKASYYNRLLKKPHGN